MSPRRSRDRRGGFLLVEALATLALSALVLAGAAALVGLLLRAADRTALSMERIETTDRAMEALARDIREAVRLPRPSGSGGGASMAFLGGAAQIMLVHERRGENGLALPVAVYWRSEATDAGRGRLIRSQAPILPGRPLPDPESGEREVVDTGEAVIRFAYFGPDPNGAGEVLTDEWTTAEALPTAVRIGAADPGSLAVGRSIRVGFPTTAEIGCANPVSGYCSLTPNRRPPEDPANPAGEQGDADADGDGIPDRLGPPGRQGTNAGIRP